MSKNKMYIKLPCLKSISVNNYALFKDNWTFNIKDGLNLFLGTNGLGKTTTANLIIFGIVGAWKDDYDELHDTYFTEREHEVLKEQYDGQRPTVTLAFDIVNSSFAVERYLDNSRIKKYSIDNNVYEETQLQDINEEYVNSLTSQCQLDNIEDLSFILRKLLVREEEGNYLLWDRVNQSKIIRLLFNPPGFFKDFAKLEKDTRNALSMANRLRDFRGQFESRKKVIEERRDKVAKRLIEGESVQSLNERLVKHTTITNETQELKDKLLEDITYLKNELKELEQSENSMSFEIGIANDEITKNEKKFFGSIYHDPRVQLLTHKLDKNHTCIVCNNSNIKLDKAKEIIDKIHFAHHCPVCNEQINVSQEDSSDVSEDLLNHLSDLRSKSNETSSNLNILKMKKLRTENTLNELFDKLAEIEKKINEHKLASIDIKLAISKLEGKTDGSNQYDRDVLVMQKEIDDYNKKIQAEDTKYRTKKKLLDQKNIELNERIVNISSKLNDVFSKYSEHFFIKDLRLTTSERQQRESKVKLTAFCPYFNDKRRWSIKQVSKSESIFLEYMFRISLIELFHQETDSLPFLILETSEGAFDLSRTNQLAKSLVEFCDNPFPFIAITNLSKPKFIKALLEDIESPRKRVFNFISYGAHGELLEKQLQKELILFKNELVELGLEDATTNY